MVDISELLSKMVEERATDLHLKAASSPFVRVNGRLQNLALPALNAGEIEVLAQQVLPANRKDDFAVAGEADFALSVSGLGRFRVSMVRQRGSVGVVFRRVATSVPSFDALGLPAPVRQLAERRAGLLLVTGPADAGKSTTVATMLNHINEHSPVSVLTVEDPIEILYADKKAFVSQREVGTDTNSHIAGFNASLRHDPDVIFIDNIPDTEVMNAVLTAASGRLVISTLPGLSSVDTIQRIIDFFPPYQTRQVRHTLGVVLQGIICQRLLARQDGRGRVGAFEVLVSTPRIRDAVVEAPGAQNLETLIATGDYYGMQTLDQHLIELHQNKLISTRDALSAAIYPQELRVTLQQSGSTLPE